MTLLHAHGLDAVEGVHWKLREISLEIAPGEVVTVLGGADAGKSLLLRGLAGAHAINAGEIHWQGRPITGSSAEARLAAGIAWSGQRPEIFPGLSIEDHLLLGAIHRRRRARAATRAALAQILPEFARRQRRLARVLALPERRLLAIGRALMSAPRLLLLDEPMAACGPARIETLIADLRAAGVAVLLVERLVEPALRVADRAMLMAGGRIVVAGDPIALYEDDRVHAACLGEILDGR